MTVDGRRVSTHSRLKAAGKGGGVGGSGKGVSTHSRLKAAGAAADLPRTRRAGFNTQPPEGGWLNKLNESDIGTDVSTHSRLKAAGFLAEDIGFEPMVSTHSRLKAAGILDGLQKCRFNVSTHSRLKAAGICLINRTSLTSCFNTQPPEGGWSLSQKPCSIRFSSPDFARLTRKARTRV